MKIKRCEAELRHFIRDTPGGMMRARAEELRISLRSACVALLFNDPVRAEEEDVEFLMWKLTVHVPIDYLRSHLRCLRKPKNKKIMEKCKTKEIAEVKRECKQLESILFEFVRISTTFYMRLLERLQRASDSSSRTARNQSIHRCFIFWVISRATVNFVQNQAGHNLSYPRFGLMLIVSTGWLFRSSQ